MYSSELERDGKEKGHWIVDGGVRDEWWKLSDGRSANHIRGRDCHFPMYWKSGQGSNNHVSHRINIMEMIDSENDNFAIA
jgi:hypothetical protein